MKAKCLIAWLFLTLGPGSVWPATFVVNSSADSHDIAPGDGVAGDHTDPDSSRCTLRAAIEEANALTGPDTVQIPTEVSPIMLRLGTLKVEDNQTDLRGVSSRPIIDGVNNLFNHASLILAADSNSVRGVVFRRSRGDALTILGAGNIIGGGAPTDRLLFLGNGLDNDNSGAIRISGPQATGNVVIGNYIGLEAGGMTPSGNRHGVIIDQNASGNRIGSVEAPGRNLISGNAGYGVVIALGAFDNQVVGNTIGADSTGYTGPGNELGGVIIKSYAHDNLIGGIDLDEGNLISGNQGHGVELTGPDVTVNVVNGNLIGCSASGRYPLSNYGDGIRVTDGAHDNLLGGPNPESGNLVSANAGNGICLRGEGVSGNVITANWVGVSLSGYGWLGNGRSEGDGILIDSGAQNNIIGGLSDSVRNVVSANYGFGVHLDGSGTNDNIVRANYIGVNAGGTSSLGNDVGVVISNGAQDNVIGGPEKSYGNVISGNRWADFPYGSGVLIYGPGTSFNTVSANIIGLDATGARPRRNGTAGVIIGSGAKYNMIGGSNLSDGNVISGNGVDDPIEGRAAGIHIYGTSTGYNRVESNLIGTDITGMEVIGNNGHGIGIYSGASHNRIGGEIFRQTNQILGNAGAGVFISGTDTKSNLIRLNYISYNEGLGIDIRSSAQDNIYPPTITRVGSLPLPGARLVRGTDAPPGARLDFYEVYDQDPSGAGEGAFYIGSAMANAHGMFDSYLPFGPAGPMVMTAIATDSSNNSSEFSINAFSADATPVEDEASELPRIFSLEQNYPNPFNSTTVICFTVPGATDAKLVVLNILGQTVTTLVDRRLSPGDYVIDWDGRDAQGQPVASGVYLYRLDLGQHTATRKMLLLK